MSNNRNLVIETYPDIFEPIKCLNKGFVRLVDFMGDDGRIVQSARVSYGSGEKSPEEDKKLINYLMKNAHTSPFEQVVFTFHVKMPIFVARQWVRHRTARLNEISGRYSVMKDDFYLPELEDVRPQSKINKQSRDENSDIPDAEKELFLMNLVEDQSDLYLHYSEAVDCGVAKEIARINLPLSLYTEMYWQIDLHNLFHFLRLRLDSHAQKEIRVYGEAMASIIKKIVPVAYEAFEEHILNSVKVSKSEYEELINFKRSYLAQME
jgi:thymidylate synthase (FAD)